MYDDDRQRKQFYAPIYLWEALWKYAKGRKQTASKALREILATALEVEDKSRPHCPSGKYSQQATEARRAWRNLRKVRK